MRLLFEWRVNLLMPRTGRGTVTLAQVLREYSIAGGCVKAGCVGFVGFLFGGVLLLRFCQMEKNPVFGGVKRLYQNHPHVGVHQQGLCLSPALLSR